MSARAKDWDRHVVDAEEVARTAGFVGLRDEIVRRAAVSPGEVVADVGAGTGLLALALADDAGTVWALDISSGMCDYLTAKAASAELDNIRCVVASAVSLPLVDASVDVVVSNYCFHHVDDDGKHRALAEISRVLRPGGRLVFGDMMFRVSVGDARDREVLAAKVRAMVDKGPAGIWRLVKNGIRFASRRWEHPAPAGWWEEALQRAGFTDVSVSVLSHEGGIASARKG